MKPKIVLVLLMFIGMSSFAQENREDETEKTVFNNVGKSLKASVFAGAEFGITALAGEAAFLTGFNAGVTFNNRWSIGGFYALSVNDITPADNIPQNTYLDLRMGGGMVEYRFLPNSLVHFTIPLLIGGGEIQLDQSGDYDVFDVDYAEKNFFVIEPGIMGELNLSKVVKFQLGATYRALIMDGSYYGFDQDDFSGVSGRAGIKIQLFN